LRAFEAAARHGGFTGAAEELCVTRGAVSRHVKLLEERLGVALFKRLPRGIALTESGNRLLPVLTDAFENIAQRAGQIASDNRDLRIICPPTLSIRWLIPRLDEFRACFPDIKTRLTTAFYEWTDFLSGDFDVGFGCYPFDEKPTGVEVLPLFPMVVTPACAPALLNGPVPLEKPENLTHFTLLHESPDHHDWAAWLAAFPVPGVHAHSGEELPNLDMAVRAAVLGKGVVMGDVVLTRDEFESGQLVMPFETMKCSTDLGDFALLGSTASWDDPKVDAFKRWITGPASVDAAYCAQLQYQSPGRTNGDKD